MKPSIIAVTLISLTSVAAASTQSDDVIGGENIKFIYNVSNINKEETYLNLRSISDTALCTSTGLLMAKVGLDNKEMEMRVNNLIGAIGLRKQMGEALLSPEQCASGVAAAAEYVKRKESKDAANAFTHKIWEMQTLEKSLESMSGKSHRAGMDESFKDANS